MLMSFCLSDCLPAESWQRAGQRLRVLSACFRQRCWFCGCCCENGDGNLKVDGFLIPVLHCYFRFDSSTLATYWQTSPNTLARCACIPDQWWPSSTTPSSAPGRVPPPSSTSCVRPRPWSSLVNGSSSPPTSPSSGFTLAWWTPPWSVTSSNGSLTTLTRCLSLSGTTSAPSTPPWSVSRRTRLSPLTRVEVTATEAAPHPRSPLSVSLDCQEKRVARVRLQED